MNVCEPFIRRPVTTTLLMVGILIFGTMAYRLLPVSDLPNIDFPTLQVSAQLPGASPETMASSVATPLERQFSTIAGLDSMSSTNALGATQITLQFNLNRDLDAAAQDVQSAISKAQKQLPPTMPAPPSYQKVNPADQPILYLTLSSPVLPLSKVNEYADTNIAQRISMVSGVAQVQVLGSQKYAVRVQLDPNLLATRSIGIDEVVGAIDRGNVNLPTGTLWGPHTAYTVQASGQLTDAAAYRPLAVAYRNGAPVRLQELGTVIDSVENDKQASWFNNTRAIILAIQKQPGTNTVAVVDAIKGLMPTFRAQLPAAVEMGILYDRSVSIRNSVNDVKFTLVLAIVLVILVIFFFLRNVSATLIPSLALPMSIVGTFAVMYLMNFSLDNMSLMALTLAVGFVVDDAIVMLENIVRHLEMGETPFEAALNGSREIGFTIISMTVSLAAVFIPVLFLAGILGRLLNEFAVTIMVAIVVSGIVSLTLTPMLCSRFLRPGFEHGKHSWLYRLCGGIFDMSLVAYRWSLRGVLKWRMSVVVLSFVLLAATVHLFQTMPKGFIPSEDLGQISGYTEAAQGISFKSMVEHQREAAKIISENPNIEAFMSSVGSGGASSSGNAGRLNIRLKPKSERKLNADQVIEQLRPQLASVTGLRVFLQNPPPVRIGGQVSKSQYQFTMQGPDTDELYKSATSLEMKMRALPELMDVTSDLQMKNPQVSVDLDRDKTAALGLSVEKVEDALYSAYGSRQVSTIYAPNNQYRVILELLPKYQTGPSTLQMLYVKNDKGALIPLSTLAKITPSVGPLSVNHSGQLPSVTISFNAKAGVALGSAVEAVQKVARETLPATISSSFQGTAQAFQSSLSGLLLLVIVAVLVIYIVLGVLYESFIHPITILSGLPSAGLGALVMLMMFGCDLNVYAFVGIIMLIGIVKKNAIMMIDFALEAERKQGLSPAEAIYEGCLVRFRPIMMTTMAALVGTLPIALGMGAGAESRRPLGLAVVGGLLVSQLLTLYVTPVVYIYLDMMQRGVQGLLGGGKKPISTPSHDKEPEPVLVGASDQS